MRVGINLLFFRPGVVGGVEVSVRALVAGLAGSGRHDLVIFTTGAGAAAFPDTPRTRVVRLGGGYSAARRAFDEFVTLRHEVRRSGIEVLLHPGNFAVLPGLGVPQVVTVNDLQHYTFPGNFSWGRNLARSILYELTVRTADRFITISEFTRADLISRFRVSPGIVTAVPLGADPIVAPDAAAVATARARHGVPETYFHYPAMVAPHKNHEMLLEALARLRERGSDVHLVLTGKFTADGRLDEAIRRHGLEGAVHGLGFVPRQDALALLAGARAMVFPSRFEGFGLPLVEAMACSVPVLASRAASIPEVVGEAGILLPDADPMAWAEAMARVLADEHLRRDLIALGLENAARYTWERSVAGTEAVVVEACREAGRGPGRRQEGD